MLPFYILFSEGMTCSEEKGNSYLRIIWFCWKKDIGLKWVKVSVVKEHQVSHYPFDNV